MFGQAPEDNSNLEDQLLSGLLIRKHLEKVGLGTVADIFNQPTLGDSPEVMITRRRGRPFSPVEPVVVGNEDNALANDLLTLTRNMNAETDAQKKQNQQLIAEIMIREGLRWLKSNATVDASDANVFHLVSQLSLNFLQTFRFLFH